MNNIEPFRFRLYVIGACPNSTKAVANLRAFCREVLEYRHEIEVVDVLREPKRAVNDGVRLTPLLVKLSPGPVRKIVGNLTDREPILQALGLALP